MHDGSAFEIKHGNNMHNKVLIESFISNRRLYQLTNCAGGAMSVVIGWDIGGVHLKAARAEDGRVTKVVQYASPLRFGTERLLQAFAEAKKDLGRADRHLITMTRELAHTFPPPTPRPRHL